jgi:hypothetical protein
MNITETTIEVCYVLAIEKMYHNKFLKQKTDKNWETYRKQRNLVTKLKKTFINKGNNKITELRTILQRESQNFYWYMFINYFYKRCFKLWVFTSSSAIWFSKFTDCKSFKKISWLKSLKLHSITELLWTVVLKTN